eukprot:2010815-Pyramimonas_sp.AAC.1
MAFVNARSRLSDQSFCTTSFVVIRLRADRNDREYAQQLVHHDVGQTDVVCSNARQRRESKVNQDALPKLLRDVRFPRREIVARYSACIGQLDVNSIRCPSTNICGQFDAKRCAFANTLTQLRGSEGRYRRAVGCKHNKIAPCVEAEISQPSHNCSQNHEGHAGLHLQRDNSSYSLRFYQSHTPISMFQLAVCELWLHIVG